MSISMQKDNSSIVKGWTIKRLVIVSVLGFAAIQVAGNGTSLLGMQKVLDDSQTIISETEIAAEKMDELGMQITQLKEQYLPLLKATQKLLQATNAVNHEVLRFVVQDAEDTDKLVAARDSLTSSFVNVERQWVDETSADVVKEMGANVSLVNDIIMELVETESPTQIAELDEDARSSSESITQTSNRLREMLYLSIERISSQINEQSISVQQSVTTSEHAANSSADNIKQMTATSMAFSAVLIFALLILGIILFRFVISPVNKILDAVISLAQGEGDLTQRLEVRGNHELSHLAQAINAFVARIDDMVSQMTYSVVRLVPMAKELSATNEQILQLSEEQREQSQSVSSHISQTVNSAEEVDHIVVQISESAKNSMTVLDSGQQIAHETIDGMDRLAKDLSYANDAVAMLKSDSEKIESIIDVINSISEQTNLLALNAAIEAARAGEAGRGFAVVADEVRNLASRTKESTLEVQSMIQSIQQKTHSVTTAMDKGVNSTSNNIDLVNKTAGAIKEVGLLMTEINEKAGKIKEATRMQNSNFQSVSESVGTMEAHIEQSLNSLENNFGFGHDLNKLSDKLQGMVSSFKITNTDWSVAVRSNVRSSDRE